MWEIYTLLYRSSHQRCSVRRGVLRNFAKFTGKYLRQSLFFNEVPDLRLVTGTSHATGKFKQYSSKIANFEDA